MVRVNDELVLDAGCAETASGPCGPLEPADLAAARQSDDEDRMQEVKTLHEQVASDLLPDGPAHRRFSSHLKARLEELRIFI